MLNLQPMTQEIKHRKIFFDILKGLAIYLVVQGHTIEFCSGSLYAKNNLSVNNLYFIFIYSFHMPLFMMISGYFFTYSIQNKSTIEILKSRLISLLLPIFSWNFLIIFIHSIVHYIHHTYILHENDSLNIITLITNYIYTCVHSLWFLWAILWCSLIVLFVNRIFKDNLFIYLGILSVTLLLPDWYFIHLYSYMLIYFIAAYIFNKYHEKTSKFTNNGNLRIYLPLCVILYISLFVFYDYRYLIYNAGYSIIGKNMLHQLYIDFYRFLIGLLGSVSIMELVYLLYKQHKMNWLCTIFAKLGIHSLGIYIISDILIGRLALLTSNFSFHYYSTIIEAILILFISYCISVGIKKIRFMNLIFWGGR